MLVVRKSGDRGHADHGWLKSWHTFSFADYHDPKHMAFRVLRVINEDFIDPHQGFGKHPHRDMEIVTYVIEGALEHKDTLGNTSVIKPGEIQRMSAGTGIQHSEFNHSNEATHLLQIWLMPSGPNLEPGYEQKDFSAVLKSPGLHKVVSGSKNGPAVGINQDVDIYVGKLENSSTEFAIRPDRHVWIQVVKGQLNLVGADVSLSQGDGLAVSQEAQLKIQATAASEFLLFDLP